MKQAAHTSAVDTTRPQERAWKSSTQPIAQSNLGRFNDCPIVGSMIRGAAVCDRVAVSLNDALARLDGDDEEDDEYAGTRSFMPVAVTQPPALHKTLSVLDFRKTWLYANSRLPPHMPPMKLYLATWQIICSAAQASREVYRRPRRDEKTEYVQADWRQGTKAMVIKSRPADDKNLIVIAIRGSKWNVVDWAVNFRPSPSEPVGFLDDSGNACHAGFLEVARAMVAPVAARLRELLEQNPSRASSSLLFTGHSAGGAVASLLYMHMMTTLVETELNILTGCFRRVHCVTFGTPPLSLLPLQTPSGRRYERNIFYNFANEGDPVVRADKQYLSTLTRIIAAPSPLSHSNTSQQSLREKVSRQAFKYGSSPQVSMVPMRWTVPPATLSNAGRMVLLREQPGVNGSIEAVQITDEQLRDVVFGDPEMHHMELYKHRVDELAIAAVTGRVMG